MTDINKLSAVDSVSDGDQIPVYSTASGGTRRVSVRDLASSIGADTQVAAAEAFAVAAEDAAAEAQAIANQYKPYVILAMGQSNMRNFFAANGGDETIEDHIYMWNTDATVNTALVAGTEFKPATWGVAPLNITNAGQRAQSLALHTANNVRRLTGRPVYVVQIAAGGHSIESFITDEHLALNSWTRPSGDQDLTAFMYPGLRDALDLVPGSPESFDAFIWHQGEANADDGADLYARKYQVMRDSLVAANVVNESKTVEVVGQIGRIAANTNWDRHAAALERLKEGNPLLRVVYSNGVELLPGGNLHFSGPGIVQLGLLYAQAIFSGGKQINFQEDTVKFSPRGSRMHFTFQFETSLEIERVPIPLSNRSFEYDNGPLGDSWYTPANTGIMIYTRRLFRVKDNQLVRISYELQVDDAAGSVDHRPVVYQYDKDKTPISSLVSLPASTPSSGADGRVFVSRTFQKFGASLGADTTLASGCEWVALGFNAGVGADDEAFWFNILELSA